MLDGLLWWESPKIDSVKGITVQTPPQIWDREQKETISYVQNAREVGGGLNGYTKTSLL